MRRLTRDRVVSVVEGKEIVGVYWEDTDGSEILFECSPEAADRIIAIMLECDQSGGEAQCVRHKCPRCDGELECVLFTEWGYKVWNGKEWVDEMPFSNAEFRCSKCNGSLDYEEVAAMGVA